MLVDQFEEARMHLTWMSEMHNVTRVGIRHYKDKRTLEFDWARSTEGKEL